MSTYGCWAIDSSWPLKLQYTWLSGYCPLVWFTIDSSRTWVAAGMALVLPQNEAGGAPVPPPEPVEVGVGVGVGVGPAPEPVVYTPNSHSE